MKRVLAASLLPTFLFVACAAQNQAGAPKPPASSALAAENGTTSALATDGTGSSTPRVTGEEPAPFGIVERDDSAEYAAVVQKVETMASDAQLRARVQRRGLSLVNVMWEDTGRAQGSSLGPNISDLTLQVRRKDDGGFHTALMPVIRFPNFTDKTGDVAADKLFVRVGNEKGQSLRSVRLSDYLKDLRAFAAVPSSIVGSGNLSAPRDSHFLVSAQAVFLPIPRSGKAEFNPALFNYQSAPGSPAVLSILVTRQGTSAKVIENRPEERTPSGLGQELYFNDKGQRSAFTAERRGEVVARIEAQGGPKTEDDRTAIQKGADVLMLIQVPLRHADRGRLGGALPPPAPMATAAPGWGSASGGAMAKPKAAPSKAAMAPAAESKRSSARDDEPSDVEQAVLGHGPHVGPFREGHAGSLERDPRFPVRVTMQFYKATSNGVVSDIDLDSIAKTVGSVYEHADFVGSLVMPDGDPLRPTSWQKVPNEWFPW